MAQTRTLATATPLQIQLKAGRTQAPGTSEAMAVPVVFAPGRSSTTEPFRLTVVSTDGFLARWGELALL